MTDMATLRDNVVDILAGVLGEPVHDLVAHPILAEHEWDSVLSLEALAQLEARLGIGLDLRDYHGARTIDDLVDLVATAVTARSGAA
jgi:acyl carrier protein